MNYLSNNFNIFSDNTPHSPAIDMPLSYYYNYLNSTHNEDSQSLSLNENRQKCDLYQNHSNPNLVVPASKINTFGDFVKSHINGLPTNLPCQTPLTKLDIKEDGVKFIATKPPKEKKVKNIQNVQYSHLPKEKIPIVVKILTEAYNNKLSYMDIVKRLATKDITISDKTLKYCWIKVYNEFRLYKNDSLNFHFCKKHTGKIYKDLNELVKNTNPTHLTYLKNIIKYYHVTP
ncbi:MAG: hypothetical protein JHC93_07825 [Parachlamydiales bacterium]|nr:hypothetical protein [Parachlamydiales bacterium]